MSGATNLRHRIRAGERVVGAMVFEFFSPGMSRILANAGAQFVIYDMEHSGLEFETLKWLFATCRGLPIEPMVRVPRSDYTWIARSLDLGARGIMVPMVETSEQALDIVQSCRRRGHRHSQDHARFRFVRSPGYAGDSLPSWR